MSPFANLVPKNGMSGPRLLDRLAFELNRRRYSPRTVQSYASWVRRFVVHHGLRHPRDLGAPEVAAFLSHLAVHDRVAASTQQ